MSMSAKEHAIGLYRMAILQGRPVEAVFAHVGDRYIQHSTGVRDGKEGFIAFFQDFARRFPEREIEFMRLMQDGTKVFLHAYQSLNSGAHQWITTDFFESDENGKIIEHWDVISAALGNNLSGRTQIGGHYDIIDLEKTDENRQLVLDLFKKCLIPGKYEKLDEYFHGDNLIQHNSELSDGLDAYKEYLLNVENPISYQENFMIVAEGNFVATLNKARLGDEDICLVDLYRVENGKIAEHWDNFEPVPPKSELVNSGKF